MNKKRNGGFTLLELMIVVGIIGVLAAISLVKCVQLIDKAREAATKSNLGALRIAITIYFADTKGIWPSELTTNTQSHSDEFFPAFIPTYLRRIPKATLQKSNEHSNEDCIEYVTTTIYGRISAEQITDKGGWIYSSTGGDIRVNCNHKDSTNSTIYYSNYGGDEM